MHFPTPNTLMLLNLGVPFGRPILFGQETHGAVLTDVNVSQHLAVTTASTPPMKRVGKDNVIKNKNCCCDSMCSFRKSSSVYTKYNKLLCFV